MESMIKELLKGGVMKKQGFNVKSRNSGTFVNYKDYSNSTLAGMVTSSSVGTTKLDLLVGRKIIISNGQVAAKPEASK